MKGYITPVTEKESYSILRKLQQFTRATWHGTGFQPVKEIPYARFNPGIKYLGIKDGVLCYYANSGDDYVMVQNHGEFVKLAAEKWPKGGR